MNTKSDWTRAQALRWRRERDEARQERDLAAADADRRSCQGGWRLAQERAVRAIAAESEVSRLRGLVRVAIAELSSPNLSDQHLRELVDDAVAAFSAAVDEGEERSA